MIKGGKGGAETTKSGLRFERDTSLARALVEAGFVVIDNSILDSGKPVGMLLENHKLYKFLEGQAVDWRSIISSKLLPDEAVLSSRSQKLTIVEKKWQQVGGSVDEKLQTCGFKLRQYRRLFEPLGTHVQFVYLLNDWFAQPRYQDVLDYIREVGADFHFKSLPLELLDL